MYETLKTFSRASLIRGCHSLFYPGGTRSRSGSINDNLKLGLNKKIIYIFDKNQLERSRKDYIKN